mgnify:CR=1 FL=1
MSALKINQKLSLTHAIENIRDNLFDEGVNFDTKFNEKEKIKNRIKKIKDFKNSNDDELLIVF